MKINYKTYPVLQALEKQSRFSIKAINPQDAQMLLTALRPGTLYEYLDNVSANITQITYVSDAFYQAAMKAKNKLLQLYTELVENNQLEPFSGAYIIKDLVFFIKYEPLGSDKNPDITLLSFYKNGMLFKVFNQYPTAAFVSSTVVAVQDAEKIVESIYVDVRLLLVVELFKRYATLETVVIEPNEKQKLNDNHEKLKNEIGLPITYLTSKWFTNIVRTEGFTVSGHFRLQPKIINGTWTKELIWINSFEKKGYNYKNDEKNY